MVTKSRHNQANREIMLDAVKAIKRGGDYRRELFAAIHLHSGDPAFFAAMEKGLTINIRMVGLVGAERMQIAMCIRPLEELKKLQRRMDIAFALGRTEYAEKAMAKILELQNKVLVDPKQN